MGNPVFTISDEQVFGNDQLLAGIADTIVTVAPALSSLPFQVVAGNTHSFIREVNLPDAVAVGANGSYEAGNTEVTAERKNVSITPLVSYYDVPRQGIRQKIGTQEGNDLLAITLQRVIKSLGRTFWANLVNGTSGSAPVAPTNGPSITSGTATLGWNGLIPLLTTDSDFSNQVIDEPGTNGDAFAFGLVDSLVALLSDPTPDFYMGNARMENQFKAALRALGGAHIVELQGKYFTAYNGVPFIRNDYITNYTVGSGSCSDLIVGNWGDGTDLGGLTALTTGSPSNLFNVEIINGLESADVVRVRAIMDTAMTVYSPKSIAMGRNIIC
jgi:hypothetical protein